MENVVLLLNLFYYEKIRYEIFRNDYEAKSKIHFLKNGSSIS